VSGNITDKTYTVRGIYRHACPNCNGPISDLRLLHKAPCEECLPEDKFRELASRAVNYSRVERLKLYANSISESRIKNLSKLVEEEDKLKDFDEFFKRATGFPMWSAQKTWARRILRRESFCIIAPTGMGKTVFSLVAALYVAKNVNKNSEKEKIYLAFPTTPLLIQSWKKLVDFTRNLGIEVFSCLLYTSPSPRD